MYTTDEIIMYAERSGIRLTGSMLERWLQMGWIPKEAATRKGAGRARGIKRQWSHEALQRALIIGAILDRKHSRHWGGPIVDTILQACWPISQMDTTNDH